MRRALRLTGNLLIAASLVGLVGLGVVLVLPEQSPTSPAGSPGFLPWLTGPVTRVAIPRSTRSQHTAIGGEPADVSDDQLRPITHIAVPSIDLSAEVVQAHLVPLDGGFTWQVPAFKVGHAESTAGAGQVGNAVLLGHVTSVHSGNVFQDLDRVQVGDTVQMFSDADEFDYRVVSTGHVPRSDSSALQPTRTPSVSLITCTGMWLPTIWDYTERLVVHAELVQ